LTLLDRLSSLELIVVTGKGGVGKSTLAAVLGRILSRQRRRTLVLEIDPRESLYPLFDVPPSGGEIERVNAYLSIQNLSPRDALDQVVRERLGSGILTRKVLGSTVYRHFSEGAPGLRELAALGHTLRQVRRSNGAAPEFDVVVLDAPASGHGISLLAAPGLVSEVIDTGPFHELAEELATFVTDPRSCGVVVVTAAEEMPVQEAIELLDQLETRILRRPEAVVVNGVYPASTLADEARDDDPALRLWLQRRRVNERELRRLTGHWTGVCIELPLVPFDRGIGLTRALATLLDESLRAETS